MPDKLVRGANRAPSFRTCRQRVERQENTGEFVEMAYDAEGRLIGTHARQAEWWWEEFFVSLGSRPLVKYQWWRTFFPHPNHLGSTTLVSDESGAVISDELFYPWGQRWASQGTLYDERFASLGPRDPLWPGQPEGLLDFTPNRTYHSRLYRWLSPDPVAGSILNPQSLNRYAYVLNNPTNLIDPLGLNVWPWDPWDDGGGGWGGPDCAGFSAECRYPPYGPWIPLPPFSPFPPSGGGGGGGGGHTPAGGEEEIIYEPDLLRRPPEEIIEEILKRMNRPSACMVIGHVIIPLGPDCGQEVMSGLVDMVLSFQRGQYMTDADREFLRKMMELFGAGEWTTRIVVGGAMTTAGGAIVYASGAAIAGAVAAGPVAYATIPISAGVGAAGVVMFGEGVDFLVTGRMRVLEEFAKPKPKGGVPKH